MHYFGLKCVLLISPHIHRRVLVKNYCLRGRQNSQLRDVFLLHSRSKHSFQQKPHFVSSKSKQSSPFLHIQPQPLKPSKDHILLVDSSSDKTNHYTLVWLLGKLLAKIAVIILARTTKNAFWSLSPEDRQTLVYNIQENYYIPCTVSGVLLSLACLYYYSHFEDTPITNRRRYMSFSQAQAAEIAEFQAGFFIEAFRGHFISGEDARAKRAVTVLRRIINSNEETKKRNKWKVYIINDPFVNAFVLSTGHIFIFNGILTLSNTDDQLAIVLGHEIAHAILNHGIESLSLNAFVDWFLIIGYAIIWFLIRQDLFDIVVTFLFERIVSLLILMPNTRHLEWEADHVGLILAAKACYDVREAGVFFRKIARLQDSARSVTLPPWMETHPDSWKRAAFLDSLLADAEGWRKANGCPPLPKDRVYTSAQW